MQNFNLKKKHLYLISVLFSNKKLLSPRISISTVTRNCHIKKSKEEKLDSLPSFHLDIGK